MYYRNRFPCFYSIQIRSDGILRLHLLLYAVSILGFKYYMFLCRTFDTVDLYKHNFNAFVLEIHNEFIPCVFLHALIHLIVYETMDLCSYVVVLTYREL